MNLVSCEIKNIFVFTESAPRPIHSTICNVREEAAAVAKILYHIARKKNCIRHDYETLSGILEKTGNS